MRGTDLLLDPDTKHIQDDDSLLTLNLDIHYFLSVEFGCVTGSRSARAEFFFSV